MASFILIFSCLSATVAILLASAWMVSRYGELAAKWMLPKEVFWIVVAVLLLAVTVAMGIKILSRFNREWVMAVSFVVGLGSLWGAWWIIIAARQRAGVVFIEIEQSDPKRIFVVGLFVALFLWAFVSAVLYTDLFMAFNGLFFASTAAMIHHLKKLPLLFSEKGVYTPNDFIAWDQVIRHQWTGDSDSTHTLVLHLRRSVVPTKMLHIPWDSFEEVNDIVEEYGVSEKTEKTPRIF